MKCERCHQRDEEIRVLKVSEGNLTSLHLCHLCAEREQLGKTARLLKDGTPFFVVRFQAPPRAREDSFLSEERCPVCGLTAEGLEREEQLPCSDCPESFWQRMAQVLFRLEELAADSTPDQDRGTVFEELLRLQRCLADAVAAEHFEEAIGLREEIRHLRQVLESGAE